MKIQTAQEIMRWKTNLPLTHKSWLPNFFLTYRYTNMWFAYICVYIHKFYIVFMYLCVYIHIHIHIHLTHTSGAQLIQMSKELVSMSLYFFFKYKWHTMFPIQCILGTILCQYVCISSPLLIDVYIIHLLKF